LPQMLLWLMAFYDVVAQKMEVFSEYCLISQNFYNKLEKVLMWDCSGLVKECK
jgi:hypothetical protein